MPKFMGWYNELVHNSREFAPVDAEPTDWSECVKHRTLKAKNESYYLLEMIKASNKDKSAPHKEPLRAFLHYAYQAINTYTSKIHTNE